MELRLGSGRGNVSVQTAMGRWRRTSASGLALLMPTPSGSAELGIADGTPVRMRRAVCIDWQSPKQLASPVYPEDSRHATSRPVQAGAQTKFMLMIRPD